MKKLYKKEAELFESNSDPAYLKSIGNTTCKSWNDVRKICKELKFSREKKAAIHKMAQQSYDRILENQKTEIDALDAVIEKHTANVQAFCNTHQKDFENNKKLLEDFEIEQKITFKIKQKKECKNEN